jgi:3-hydroxyisobutyrate dehydrogenase
MGAAFAINLRHAGIDTTVWDRTPDSTVASAAAGATVASSPTEAVAHADVVITMLPDADAVTDVLDDQGTLKAFAPKGTWVQMGTIGLAGTDRMAALVAEQRPDVSFVDAPVSGSKTPAEHAQLLILASGPPAVRTQLEPVFDALGRRTLWLGEAGQGMRLKLVLNAWMAFVMEGLAETTALADALGVTHAQLEEALDGSPLAAPWALDKLTNKIDSGDFALDSAHRHLPALAAIGEQWRQAVSEGYGSLDISAARPALEPRGAHAGSA